MPEFAELLAGIPDQDREGFAFDPTAGKVRIGKKAQAVNGRQVDTVGKVITELGRQARVKVNDQGKPASAHDLRRSYGVRWSSKITPTVLCKLMRHSLGLNDHGVLLGRGVGYNS